MAIRQRNFIIPREQQSIDRQQALAQALMTPQGLPQEWAGQRVTPQYGLGHGLTALASALAGGYVAKKANEQQRDFDEQTRIGNEGIIHDLTRDPRPQKLDAAGQGIPGTEPQDLLDIDTGRPELSARGKMMSMVLGGMDPQQARQYLAQQAMVQLAPPKYERVDLGDAIGITDERGNVVKRLPKGFEPGAVLSADTSRRGQDITLRGQDLSAETSRRGQDLTASTTRRGQDVTLRGQDLSAETTRRGQDVSADTTARGREATAAATADQKQREVSQVWDLYSAARDGLLRGLDASVTGPVMGRIPAFTSEQQTAEGGVSAMAPVLKQLFRVSGEGTFTDRDQALLLQMVPDRTDRPEAREAKIRNIDTIVRAKLGMGSQQPARIYSQDESAAMGVPAASEAVMQRARSYYGP